MKNPASLHDLLVAWQAGKIGYREAMERAQIETLDELYEAAHLSGFAKLVNPPRGDGASNRP